MHGHLPHRSRLWLACRAALLVAAAAAGPAMAQDAVAPAGLQDAFEAMLAEPGRLDLAVRYARLAAAEGDVNAAIGALERVLRLDPTLDNIRLELASLHLAAGAPDLAAAYAREALVSPAIPPEVVPRARSLLERAERGAARSSFDVLLSAGLRYDSNANEATSLGTVPIFVPVLQDLVNVPTPVRGRSDWSAVFGARIAHRQDLGLQREAKWETFASAYEQRFARIPRAFDLSIASLDTGPRMEVLQSGGVELFLRPFASASWLGYGGETYAWLYGGGLTAELRPAPRWSLELTWLSRFGNYESSDFRPRAREFTGGEQAASATAAYWLAPGTRVSATLTYSDSDAREAWWARRSWGGYAALTTTLPLSATHAVDAGLRAGVRRVRFDAPDPFIDPSRRRRDTRWDAGATLVFPVMRSVAIALDYEWYDQDSNYGFYRYGNHAVMLGLRIGL